MSEPEIGYDHVAVEMNNRIIVFGARGKDSQPKSLHKIWTYNVYTEQWREHVISAKITVPVGTYHFSAVALGPDIYMFGGVHAESVLWTNDLWKLSRTSDGCFNWNKLEFQSHVTLPSPRHGHSSWEHVWVFGGYGALSTGYLNDYGDFTPKSTNNQLLCYNPASHIWTNSQCFGNVPSPRFAQCTTMMMHQVWLYGGCNDLQCLGTEFDDLFELHMRTNTWTQIHANMAIPQARQCASLNATSDGQLVLHGGIGLNVNFRETWVMDLPSQTWIQRIVHADHLCYSHAGTVGVNKCVIIIGGILIIPRLPYGSDEHVHTTFYVRLEPKSLQQLAMQMIYEQRTVLPWHNLPSKLIAQFEIPKDEEITS